MASRADGVTAPGNRRFITGSIRRVRPESIPPSAAMLSRPDHSAKVPQRLRVWVTALAAAEAAAGSRAAGSEARSP